MQNHWPGNVRELSNFIKRLLVLRDENLALEELRVSKPPAAIAPGSERRSPADLRREEAEMIMQALQQFNGNKRLAASALKMSYNVFLQKEKEYRKTVKASATSA
jgi:DNA-binding NtrC family response regulator